MRRPLLKTRRKVIASDCLGLRLRKSLVVDHIRVNHNYSCMLPSLSELKRYGDERWVPASTTMDIVGALATRNDVSV